MNGKSYYYTWRDVYPLSGLITTRGKTKVPSDEPDKPVNLKETSEESIIDKEQITGMAKIMIGIVLTLYLVNRFGK